MAMAFSLAACGSDATSAPPAESSGTTAPERTADFCRTVVDIDKTVNSTPPPEALPPDQVEAVMGQIAAQLDPLLTRAEQTAPAAVSGDVATLVRLTRQGFGGDQAAFESPELAPADAKVDRFMLAECGYDENKVTAVNFEFQGLSDSLPAGTHAITLTNEGDQLHEIAVARINDDVTMPLDQLLMLPMEEALSKIELAGIAFAAPGETTTAFLDVRPGRYFAACFIPEGTTTTAEGQGPPHFTMGMLTEFAVS